MSDKKSFFSKKGEMYRLMSMNSLKKLHGSQLFHLAYNYTQWTRALRRDSGVHTSEEMLPWVHEGFGAAKNFQDLLKVVDGLLGPEGCEWDQSQTFYDWASCLRDESKEVMDAVLDLPEDREPTAKELYALMSELGDVFFVTSLIAFVAMKKGWFTVTDVLQVAVNKILFRHPHVFGSEGERNSPAPAWADVKEEENEILRREGLK